MGPPQPSTLKILTVGSALGSIRDLFAKVKSIDAKHGKFDLVLCTGDFFGAVKEGEADDEETEPTQLLEGKLEAPLPCYIMQGELPLPTSVIEKFAKTSGELCHNVFLLGKSATFTTAEGLRIACLGGTYDPKIFDASEVPHGFTSPYFTSQTVSKLLSNTISSSSAKSKSGNSSLASIMSSASTSSTVDILISHVWPSCITTFSSAPLPSPQIAEGGAPPIDELIKKIKPRYLFSSCGNGTGIPSMFWEREPFVWDDEGGRVSRFVSLGAFGGEAPTSGKKQRWFYAFSIPLQSATATARPANATLNPFTEGPSRPHKRPLDMSDGENFRWGNNVQKRTRTGEQGQGQGGKPPAGYVCKRCESTDHFINDCPERSKPPEGYICKICNTPGHLVRDCPTRHNPGDTGGRKPREGYVCRACGSEAHYIEDCPVISERRATQHQHGHHQHGQRRGPPKEIGPSECWFCLSNPSLAKHLIVAIGNECYVTLPKGQIIPTHHRGGGGGSGGVPGGGHVLIVPIAHFATLSSIPGELRQPVLNEIGKYKSALRAFYAKHNSVPVFFEVGRISAKGGHSHIQVIPVPLSLKSEVEAAFIDEGKPVGIEFEVEQADAPTPGEERGSYFRVELPAVDGENGERRLVHWMRGGVPFSVQFGRQVLAKLLKMEERVDWKACMQSEAEDREDVQAFKTAFAPFDPSM